MNPTSLHRLQTACFNLPTPTLDTRHAHVYLPAGALNQTYTDNNYNVELPVYAAAELPLRKGCWVESILPSDIQAPPRQFSYSGRLAATLPEIPCWKTEIEDTQTRKLNRTLTRFSQTALILSIVLLTTMVALQNSTIFSDLQLFCFTLAAFSAGLLLGCLEALRVFSAPHIVLPKTHPDIPVYRDIHKKDHARSFISPAPTEISEAAKTLIEEEEKNYARIHLVWDSTGYWKKDHNQAKNNPPPEALIFGETQTGIYALLGNTTTGAITN